MSALLEVAELTRQFGGLRAVGDLSFKVDEHEIVGLIGPNGAGKTTAFNLISGTLPPTRGTVHFRGQQITGMRAGHVVRLGLARTFQSTNVFKTASVYENIARGAMLRYPVGFFDGIINGSSARAAGEKANARAEELLELFGLAPFRDVQAGSLAYGLQRRLGVAIVVATSPSILLLDEPVAGLNPEESAELGRLIKVLAEREKLTILLVEHHMRFVMNLCNRIVVLDHGEKIAEGTPSEIQNDSKVIEAYLGDPEDDEHA